MCCSRIEIGNICIYLVFFNRLQDNVLKEKPHFLKSEFHASSVLKDLFFAALQISRSSLFLPKKVINKKCKTLFLKRYYYNFTVSLKSARHRNFR
jgi:hypothetical protein